MSIVQWRHRWGHHDGLGEPPGLVAQRSAAAPVGASFSWRCLCWPSRDGLATAGCGRRCTAARCPRDARLSAAVANSRWKQRCAEATAVSVGFVVRARLRGARRAAGAGGRPGSPHPACQCRSLARPQGSGQQAVLAIAGADRRQRRARRSCCERGGLGRSHRWHSDCPLGPGRLVRAASASDLWCCGRTAATRMRGHCAAEDGRTAGPLLAACRRCRLHR
mmetsp:Transcript_96842/g.269318  ORF Transcript_96842/g.269318 Transcript_96842/m.269318 type:complete len:221 (+) Transcript_96842:102-764(+)